LRIDDDLPTLQRDRDLSIGQYHLASARRQKSEKVRTVDADSPASRGGFPWQFNERRGSIVRIDSGNLDRVVADQPPVDNDLFLATLLPIDCNNRFGRSRSMNHSSNLDAHCSPPISSIVSAIYCWHDSPLAPTAER
jgi:hypothetical protein